MTFFSIKISRYYIRISGLILFSLLLANLSLAQSIVYLEASDHFNGEKLPVEFRVESKNTGHSYVIITETGEQYFKLNAGDEVNIKTFLDGYYDDNKDLKEEDISGGEGLVEFSLEKRPTASLNLTAKALESGRGEPAYFELFFEGRMVGRGNTSRNDKTYQISLTQAGTYRLVTTAQGFAENTEEFEVGIGTPVNVIVKEIGLARPSKEVALRFIDEQSGDLLKAQIQISNDETGEVYFEKSVENGIVLFTFNDDINYKIKANVEHYTSLDRNIQGAQREDLILRLRPITFVVFKIVDSKTQREIEAEVKISSPENKVVSFREGTENSFLPEELGSYRIEIFSPGYISKTGTVQINSFSGGKVEHSFQLEEADKQFYVKFIDHFSKEQVENFTFRVFGPGGVELKGIEQNEEGEYVFITDPSKKYFIEGASPGYENITNMLSEDEKHLTVELFWTIEATHTYEIREQHTERVMEEANLKIRYHDKEIFIYKTSSPGIFKAKLNSNESYAYFPEADGYKFGNPALSSNGNNSKILYLTKAGSKLYDFKVIDFLTKQPLLANVRYFIGQKEIELTKDQPSGIYKGEYNADEVYSFSVSLDDYRGYRANITAEMIEENQIVIPIKKDFYTVSFNIENISDPKELRSAKLRVFSDARDRSPESFVASTRLYQADLDGDTRYTLEISKDGYEVYSSTFYVRDLVEEGFVKTLELIEIPVIEPEEKEEIIPLEVEEELVVENVTEDARTLVPIAIVAEEVTETIIPDPVVEKKVEPEKIATIAEARDMPENAGQMADSFKEESSIGKRYLLDEVFFNQSSAAIRDEEVTQLNELAKTLQGNENLVVEIVGYTDNIGDPRLNLGLSKNRAKAVANYLFYKGANPDRILSTGFGQDSAVAQNNSEENRAKNRRVELVLVEN